MDKVFSPQNRRWMIVDDNADVLTMLAEVVRLFTDAVVECHSSPQFALAAFIANPGSYELVITDFEMPGMSGVELCRRLHAVSAMQKVFLATGSGNFNPAVARSAGFSGLLRKPFPITALHDALAAVGLIRENGPDDMTLHPAPVSNMKGMV